jgi:hypothetical protein
MDRREEPPRYESGLRAHGSNQRFHRLLRHAVARALTTAPSLAGVSPVAGVDSHPSWVAAQGAARDAVAQRFRHVSGTQSAPSPTRLMPPTRPEARRTRQTARLERRLWHRLTTERYRAAMSTTGESPASRTRCCGTLFAGAPLWVAGAPADTPHSHGSCRTRVESPMNRSRADTGHRPRASSERSRLAAPGYRQRMQPVSTDLQPGCHLRPMPNCAHRLFPRQRTS